MMNDENKFFVVEYSPDGDGIPHFMDKTWVPKLPGYDLFTAPPSRGDFSDSYSLKVGSYKLNGDYFPHDNLISFELLGLMFELDVKFIHIPVKVGLHKKKSPEKKYFLFYILSYLSILDEDKSIFVKSKNIEAEGMDAPEEGGGNKIYYERIDKFIIKNGVQEHLFMCNEISKPVCSLEFKGRFESLGLRGIGFEEIDSDYKYDAWSGW